jgi:hypothetical protein
MREKGSGDEGKSASQALEAVSDRAQSEWLRGLAEWGHRKPT